MDFSLGNPLRWRTKSAIPIPSEGIGRVVMYQCRMSEVQFAGAFEGLEVTGRQIVGPATITTGESERYGALVLIQTSSSFHAIYEIAQSDEPDLESTGEEVTAFQKSLSRAFGSITAECCI